MTKAIIRGLKVYNNANNSANNEWPLYEDIMKHLGPYQKNCPYKLQNNEFDTAYFS
jgi:hypothetical protein